MRRLIRGLAVAGLALAFLTPAAILGSAHAEDDTLTDVDDLVSDVLEQVYGDPLTEYPPDVQAIVNYAVDVEVLPDTDMIVSERITYNTGTAEVRRGIIRDIPTADLLDGGLQRTYDVSLIEVTRDGEEVTYTVDDFGDLLSLRIGDEDIPILGLYEFEITYRVSNGLDVIDEGDITSETPAEVQPGDIELYWDFVGDQWDFPIYSADVSVRGPSPAVAALCFADTYYMLGCEVDLNNGPDGATTLTARSTGWSGEGWLTGAIAWRPDAFTAVPTPVIAEDPMTAEMSAGSRNIGFGVPLGLAALVIPIITALLLRRRSKGIVLAAAPVRYEPPEGMRPAMLQAGIEGEVAVSGIAATLADLAARGHLTIEEEEKRLFQKERLLLNWKGTGRDPLLDWEEDLLEAVFKGQPAAVIGEYDPMLAAAIKTLSSRLGTAARMTGSYNPEGYRPDRPYRFTAFAGALGIVASIVAVITGAGVLPLGLLSVLFPISLGLIIGGVAGAIITPRRQTQTSATFLSQAEGFRRFLDSDSAAARRDFAERSGMPDYAVFATFLPYAIALGLEDTWIHSFPDLDPTQLSEYGIRATTWLAFSSITSTMTSSVSAGSTSRSSGSGLGGGGGGGGGGVGGGGSSF
jgi:uncharacterized membrane protein YgcG